MSQLRKRRRFLDIKLIGSPIQMNQNTLNKDADESENRLTKHKKVTNEDTKTTVS